MMNYRIRVRNSDEVVFPYDLTFINGHSNPATFSIVDEDLSIAMYKWDDEFNVLNRLIGVLRDTPIYVDDVIETNGGIFRVREDSHIDCIFDVYEFEDLDDFIWHNINPKEIKLDRFYNEEEHKSCFDHLDDLGIKFIYTDVEFINKLEDDE